MRELMTHTAGLSYGFNPAEPLDKLYQQKQVWQSASLAVREQGGPASLPLAYQPGSGGSTVSRWTCRAPSSSTCRA